MEMEKDLNQEVNLEQEQHQEQQQEEQDNNQEQEFKWDEDLFKKLIMTPEGKKEFNRAMDKHFTKGLETWKTNNLEKLVNEKYEQLHPSDPKEQEIIRLKKELAQKQIQDETITMLEEAEIPVSFSNYFKSDNLETTKETIKTFMEHFNKAVRKEVNKRLAGMGSTPISGIVQQQQMTKAEIAKLPYEERVILYMQNPSLFN